ncbi:MAG: hypothetical protein WCL71_01080 [Deltaproteobacteria bacterium]
MSDTFQSDRSTRLSLAYQNTLKSYINQSAGIFKAAVAILDTTKLLQPVRQLGVKLSNLSYESEQL